MKMTILFFGPPGAGKGTQARILSRTCELPYIETSGVLRKKAKEKSAIGDEIRGYLESGKLVPDEIVIEAILDELKKDEYRNGFILDGFPRTKRQVKALEKFLEESQIKIVVPILIEVPDAICTRRILSRRRCPKCGKTYNLELNPPRNDELCDICGVKLERRKDDTEEKIKVRLKEYWAKTAEAIKHYEGKRLLRINGVGTVEEVQRRIKDAIEEYIKTY